MSKAQLKVFTKPLTLSVPHNHMSNKFLKFIEFHYTSCQTAKFNKWIWSQSWKLSIFISVHAQSWQLGIGCFQSGRFVQQSTSHNRHVHHLQGKKKERKWLTAKLFNRLCLTLKVIHQWRHTKSLFKLGMIYFNCRSEWRHKVIYPAP